jgi:hypothetical protein
LDQNPIPAGRCTTVRWDTSGLRELYYDGQPVTGIGTQEVCPKESQTYALRVVTLGGVEHTHTLVLGVIGDTPASQATANAEVVPTVAATTMMATPVPSTAVPDSATAYLENPVPSPSPDSGTLVAESAALPTLVNGQTPATVIPTQTVAYTAMPSPVSSSPSATPVVLVSISEGEERGGLVRAQDAAASRKGEKSNAAEGATNLVWFAVILAGLILGLFVLWARRLQSTKSGTRR